MKYLDVTGYTNSDLEDYYTNIISTNSKSFMSSIDVAEVLSKSANDVVLKRMKAWRKEPTPVFYKMCKKIEHLARPKKIQLMRML